MLVKNKSPFPLDGLYPGLHIPMQSARLHLKFSTPSGFVKFWHWVQSTVPLTPIGVPQSYPLIRFLRNSAKYPGFSAESFIVR